MEFTTTLQLDGKTATGIRVPDEAVAALGGGKRIPVSVTINGTRYASTIMSGNFATCPITQGSLMRLLIREDQPASAARDVLNGTSADPRHEFWPDDARTPMSRPRESSVTAR